MFCACWRKLRANVIGAAYKITIFKISSFRLSIKRIWFGFIKNEEKIELLFIGW